MVTVIPLPGSCEDSGSIKLQVGVGIAALMAKPTPNLAIETELLFGEEVVVEGAVPGWFKVRTTRDHYLGWVQQGVFRRKSDPIYPTHYVCVPATAALEEPAVQSLKRLDLGMNARVEVIDQSGKFVKLRDAGWVNVATVRPIGEFAHDFVDVALMFRYSPYSWGGRTGLGLDCSALVQTSLIASGRTCPRNSGQQREYLGTPVDYARRGLKRGNLVFWEAHVGIMLNEQQLIHATADVMQVVIEPVQTVVERMLREENKSVLAVKALPSYGQ